MIANKLISEELLVLASELRKTGVDMFTYEDVEAAVSGADMSAETIVVFCTLMDRAFIRDKVSKDFILGSIFSIWHLLDKGVVKA